MTPERQKVVDFTPPFYTSGVSAVMLRQSTARDPLEFLKPFRFDLWLLIVASVIIYGIFLFVTSRMGEKSKANPHILTLPKSLATIGHAFIQQEGDFTPRSLGERIIMVTWRVYSLVLIATYTATFTAFLSAGFNEKGIDTFEELLDSDMTYGMEDDTSNFDFFRYSPYTKYRKAYDNMEKWGTIYSSFSNMTESLRRLSLNEALITDDLSVRLMRKEKGCMGDIYETKPINFEELSFALRPGLEAAPNISKRMSAYGRRGYLTKLINQHWPICPSKKPDHRVGIDRLGGFFIIMSIGAAIAMISPWIASWDMTRVKMIRLCK